MCYQIETKETKVRHVSLITPLTVEIITLPHNA
jgi:hypothetical protein